MVSPKICVPKLIRKGSLPVNGKSGYQRGDSQKGFTLLEIVVVMAMLAVIAGLSMLVGMNSYRSGSFRNDRDAAVSMLQRARAQSINNVCRGSSCTDGKPHGVRFYPKGNADDDKFIIFQGVNFHDTADDALVDEPAQFSSFTVYVDSSTTDPIDIIFDRLSGNLLNAASTSLILKDEAGNTSVIDVNSEGRISWTN